ncbi:MAG: peptide deformylase, partial [Thermaurantiacus tibetensis]
MTDLAARLDRLESRNAIHDLASTYMRGLDRLDLSLTRSVFHDDATTDYGEGWRGDVDRSFKIQVVALDRQGKKVYIDAEGILSIILQHEIDHLDGVLFID